MEFVLIAGLIVSIWLVLGHIRRQQFLKEYMGLQRQALEKGVALPGDLKEIQKEKTDWSAVALRVGIISLILGITGVIIGLVILPKQPGIARETDAAAIFATFWAFGLLLAAFGLGNLLCWFLIDRKRGGKNGKNG